MASRRVLALLPLIVACAPGDDDAVDGEVAGVVDPTGPPLDQVVTRFRVADPADAFDLDGDGDPDHALAGLGSLLDPIVAERLAGNVHVVLVQLAGLGDLAADPHVRVGVFPAVDTDNDGSDNGSGDEVFDATGFVDDVGVALVGGDAPLADGTYEAWLDVHSFQIGSFVFDVATGVHVRGAVQGASQTGTVGIGVTVDALAYALDQEGFDASMIALLSGLADLDLDGDGTNDALSMAFGFDAATCAITSTP